MRFGRRDHEPFIGGYDPEHEMPDPGRQPGDRWQSEAYRHNARDSRFAYRWDPDRFEERHGVEASNDRESPNRDNWSSGDFDQRWDFGRGEEERDLPSDRGYVRHGTYGAYRNMRDWDRRRDGERYASDWGWGQSGRHWEHGRDFDDRGRKRRW